MMHSTTPLTIAVTGLNATDNPAPGVAVLRSLRHGDGPHHRLVGLAYDALDPGIYARGLADDVFMLPYPSSSPESFLERLLAIHARVPLSVVVPTLDAELPTFIELAPRLRELGIGTLLPTREQYDARSKANLATLARSAGLRTPETCVINSVDALLRMEQRLRFPFFVKGLFYGAKLVTTVDEALAAFHATVAEWGLPVIAQACVPGENNEERNVVALGDGEGGLLGAVAMKKLAITDKGKAWAGVTIRDPELHALTERFVRATHWRGACEIEVMRANDGSYNLIEINPRFPAWIYLATCAGMNLPRRSVEIAAGRAVTPHTDYAVGTLFVRISIDQVTTISELEQMLVNGELTRAPGPREVALGPASEK
jgi:carbamoyl-phosphate synthase large subunit